MPSSFELVYPLRSGHASVVWRCKDSRLDRVVAVKFIESKDCAKEEVRTIHRFWHPNIINAVDFIKWNESFGIVMHAMDMDLRCFMETELYDSALVCDISRQCARGLHHVHEHQTLHADVKPENIGISITKPRSGNDRLRIHIRLLDFGSAKLLVDLKKGTEIRSTLHYQSPEKRQGVFHLPGDIYELGVVYREVIENSVDNAASHELYGGLISDMLQSEYLLRPTSQELLVRLDDPHTRLWEQINKLIEASKVMAIDVADLVACEDPLTFLMRDLSTRMEYIIRMATGDNLQCIERAFFLLYKTAQHEAADFMDAEPVGTVLQYIHYFHGTVDTTWWTKLFYSMAVEAVSEMPYFVLSDTMKIKLWTFSGISDCESFVRNTLQRCMSMDLLKWCMEHRWGGSQLDFVVFIDGGRVSEELGSERMLDVAPE
jgi:serine/threonine protein kinase